MDYLNPGYANSVGFTRSANETRRKPCPFFTGSAAATHAWRICVNPINYIDQLRKVNDKSSACVWVATEVATTGCAIDVNEVDKEADSKDKASNNKSMGKSCAPTVQALAGNVNECAIDVWEC